jgi:phosphotriesterase-related protein
VETLRGAVPVEELGQTLIHEHLFVKNPELEENYPSPDWDEEVMVAKAIATLNALYDRGIRTFVDLTVMGLGRSIQRIQRIAAETKVHIIAATGFYTAKDLPMYFHNNGPGLLIDGPDPLIRMFIDDITVGIADTGVKAALLKVVTDEAGITKDVARVMQAAAVAHQETGATIMTHTNAALKTGLLQQEFYRKAGVPLEYVVIGHCGDSTDLDYLRELMDNGSTIGMDRFGLENLLEDSSRTKVVAELCALGYAEKLALSHDAPLFTVNRPATWRAEAVPNWNNTNLSDNILPALRNMGVSDETIHQMMIVNPARILAGRH